MKSEKYLDYVRTLPCCHCGTIPAEPHHIIGIGDGAMGKRASDLHTMPLCRSCHSEVHKDPKSWPQCKWMTITQRKAAIDGVLEVIK